MTTAQYAAHRGVSDSYVRRLRREGRLVEAPGRLIDVAATDAHLDATNDPLRGGVRKPGDDTTPVAGEIGGEGLREAMRRERMARARLAELELGEEAKELTRRKDVDRAVFTLARQALERLRTIPSRLRTKLAAEADPRACEALLDAEVEIVCKDLQKAAAAMVSANAAPADDTPASPPSAASESA
jgi:hypothetical protein